MTNEELLNQLDSTNPLMKGANYEALKDYILSLRRCVESAEKNKWHDLRKDPEDLPEDRDKIICYYENRFAAVGYYEFGEYGSFGKVFPNIDDYDMDVWEVQAWKLLEPFTDDYIMPENSDHRKQRGRTAPNEEDNA